MLLANKTILITGASKGIGRATSLLLASEGCRTILISREIEVLRQLKDEITQKGFIAPFVQQVDLRNIEQINALFQELTNQKIFLDGLVNNAGIMTESMLLFMKPKTLMEIYETNVFSIFYLTQFAIKSIIRKKKGSIINISSIIGDKGQIGQTIYGSSKSALIGFTKSLSKELAPLNIRVNAISPGFIQTDMTKNIDFKITEKILQSIGMRRPGLPEDVANVILFLASNLSEYVTGQVIGVDGGLII